jgi:hypothetical protein
VDEAKFWKWLIVSVSMMLGLLVKV